MCVMFSRENPTKCISLAKWNAMLKWHDTRMKEGVSIKHEIKMWYNW